MTLFYPRPLGHSQWGNTTAVHNNETMADVFSMTMNASDLLTNTTNFPFYHLQHGHFLCCCFTFAQLILNQFGCDFCA